jgi:hypothetical protein
MPQIRISNPNLVDELAADLRKQTDTIVELAGDGKLIIHIVGSYSTDGMRLATYLRLRAWEAAQRAHGRDVSVEIVDDWISRART